MYFHGNTTKSMERKNEYEFSHKFLKKLNFIFHCRFYYFANGLFCYFFFIVEKEVHVPGKQLINTKIDCRFQLNLLVKYKIDRRKLNILFIYYL